MQNHNIKFKIRFCHRGENGESMGIRRAGYQVVGIRGQDIRKKIKD